jgi:uncharacterized protein YggE
MESQSFWLNKSVQLLGKLLLVMAVIALGAYTYLTLKQAEGTYTGETTISVSGTGEVMAVPDIGQFSFAVRAEGETAEVAQTESAEAINAIVSYLEGEGIAKTDIKTENYNLQPRYRYEERLCTGTGYCPPGERVLDGYEVNQNVSVKVRELDRSGEFIAGVGDRGATNISSLQFTIDNEDDLQAEARSAAIADARTKANALAKDLGLRVHKVVGFHENEGGYYPMMERSMMAMDSAEGLGGATPPSLPTGENEVAVTVNVTYELR